MELREKAPGFAFSNKKKRGAAKAGLEYERKVHECLSDEVGAASYVSGQWFRYKSTRNSRWCFAQTDGMWVDHKRKRLVIVEIKLRHTSRAWWQLRQLYQPIVEHKFTGWRVEVVEVFKWWNPKVKLPETVHHVDDWKQYGTEYRAMKLVV